MGKKKAAGKKSAKSASNGNGANLGFEQKLWLTADKLRNNMDAAEYKHVVLGLIFLKYISDAFEEQHANLQRMTSDPKSEWYVKEESQRYQVMEDPDEYRAETFSGFPRKHDGRFSRARPSSPPSANWSMKQWLPSNETIRDSRASCQRTTPGLRWTSIASVS